MRTEIFSLKQVLALAGLMTAGLFVGFSLSTRNVGGVSVDVARAERNQKVLAACDADWRKCLGGFVRTNKGNIFRIDTCGRSCPRLEMDVIWLIGQMKMKIQPERIVEIVLPYDPRWAEVAVEQARQYVEERDLVP